MTMYVNYMNTQEFNKNKLQKNNKRKTIGM